MKVIKWRRNITLNILYFVLQVIFFELCVIYIVHENYFPHLHHYGYKIGNKQNRIEVTVHTSNILKINLYLLLLKVVSKIMYLGM